MVTRSQFWNRAEFYTLLVMIVPTVAFSIALATVTLLPVFLLDVAKIAANSMHSRMKHLNAAHHAQRAAAILLGRWK